MKLTIMYLVLLHLVVKLPAEENQEKEQDQAELDTEEVENKNKENEVIKKCYEKSETDFDKCVIWNHSTKYCDTERKQYLSRCLPQKSERKEKIMNAKEYKEIVKRCNTQADTDFNHCVIWELSTKTCEEERTVYLSRCYPKAKPAPAHPDDEEEEENTEVRQGIIIRSQNTTKGNLTKANTTEVQPKMLMMKVNLDDDDKDLKNQSMNSTTYSSSSLKTRKEEFKTNPTPKNEFPTTQNALSNNNTDSFNRGSQIGTAITAHDSNNKTQTQKDKQDPQKQSNETTSLAEDQTQILATSTDSTQDKLSFLDSISVSLEYDVK